MGAAPTGEGERASADASRADEVVDREEGVAGGGSAPMFADENAIEFMGGVAE